MYPIFHYTFLNESTFPGDVKLNVILITLRVKNYMHARGVFIVLFMKVLPYTGKVAVKPYWHLRGVNDTSYKKNVCPSQVVPFQGLLASNVLMKNINVKNFYNFMCTFFSLLTP